MEEVLVHYGMKRRSGRYPFGSGEDPFQHEGDFIARVDSLRADNFTFTDEDGKTYTGDTAIARYLGMTTTEFRTQISLCKDERMASNITHARNLKDAGYSDRAIATEMGISESSVRNYLKGNNEYKTQVARNIADIIKKNVDEKGVTDVGAGVEVELGVTKEKLDQALTILKNEGYEIQGGRIPQVTNKGQMTTVKVVCPPGSPKNAVYTQTINSINDYTSEDGGATFKNKNPRYPVSMDISRLQVVYAEDGGTAKDGLIELRRGVDDLYLGDGKHYSQVRILVDDDKYLKGMAVYADDLPDGVDVRFNSSKSKEKGIAGSLKKIKTDEPNNPFGSTILPQDDYIDINGETKQSLINKRADEGDWDEWGRTLPAQFLAKQNMKLINQQLDISKQEKRAEYDEIMALENPTVKKVLLESFARDCDSTAEHLDAAAIPGQRYQVILPVNSLKDNECYAPNYENGTQLALVRFPHGGTFEIPVVTVNNHNKDAEAMIGHDARDAVCINSKVAAQLSGADFDGDTVMVLPNTGDVKISSRPYLTQLEGFDPKTEYPYHEGMKVMTKKYKQNAMGQATNLIADMQIRGNATDEEIANAVKYSMVVIDAEKHKLDYQQAYSDCNIKYLKQKYQSHIGLNGRESTGASTLITRAKAEIDIPQRQGQGKIDPETGEMIYKESGRTDWRTGKPSTQKSTQMAYVKDAYQLSSGTIQEAAYAEYANSMKLLANEARKSYLNAGKIEYSPSAAKTYAAEVNSLKEKQKKADLNKPRERQAQMMAQSLVKSYKEENPNATKEEVKKASQRYLNTCRTKVGASRNAVEFTDKEWEAIQAGAVSENVLTSLLNSSNLDQVRELATPREKQTLSEGKISRLKAMNAKGYTNAEIADALGISASSVYTYLNGGN